jgi:hypothetical protein
LQVVDHWFQPEGKQVSKVVVAVVVAVVAATAALAWWL